MHAKQSGVSTSLHHVPLASSNLASVAYCPDEQLLELRFRSGALYRYVKVPPSIHGALLVAESKGRYFNEAIRGRFGYQRG